MKLILKRIAENIYGTFGVLLKDNIPFALTVERRWLENIRGASCIPAGRYDCVRVRSPKFGNTFMIADVPNRSEILFHKGNIQDDSHGCIIIGEQFESLSGRCAILSSQKGFSEFIELTKDVNEFIIDIIKCF